MLDPEDDGETFEMSGTAHTKTQHHIYCPKHQTQNIYNTECFFKQGICYILTICV